MDKFSHHPDCVVEIYWASDAARVSPSSSSDFLLRFILDLIFVYAGYNLHINRDRGGHCGSRCHMDRDLVRPPGGFCVGLTECFFEPETHLVE
jgi:hypothetical protein